MEIFVEPFVHNAFLWQALVAGGLVAIAGAIVGSLMVLRGLAFIGEALAHGLLPGVAAAILFGLPGMAGAAVASLVMVTGIGVVLRRSALSADTAIGLLFVGMLALGVAMVSAGRGFNGDLLKILFGEILGVSPGDLVIQAGLTLVLVVLAILFRRPFLLLCFNTEQAEAAGFSARLYHGLMLAMIALTVVVSFQTVGTLLVFGILIAPAATAALFARRLGSMMVTAAGLGIAAVFGGLLLSYHAGLAAGPAIVMVSVAGFFVGLVARQLTAGRHRSPTEHVHG